MNRFPMVILVAAAIGGCISSVQPAISHTARDDLNIVTDYSLDGYTVQDCRLAEHSTNTYECDKSLVPYRCPDFCIEEGNYIVAIKQLIIKHNSSAHKFYACSAAIAGSSGVIYHCEDGIFNNGFEKDEGDCDNDS